MPGVKPDLIIYLHTTPQAAMKRIITRGRPEESGIAIEYLARLHQKYEGWLRDPNFNTPVITVFASFCLIFYFFYFKAFTSKCSAKSKH